MTPKALALALLCSILLLSQVSASCRQDDSLTVRVTVICPPGTPEDASIFIAGNSPLLGDWNPGGVKMERVSDSVRTFSWRAGRGEVVEWKITRGSWSAQAVFQAGTIPENFRLKAAKDTSIILKPITWSDLDGRKAIAGGVSGMARYHTGLKGNGLRYPKDLVVWLPPSYDQNPSVRYPVLYMHDGQNVFDPATSFLGYDWRVDEVADSLIRAGAVREMIVVGISNSPDRTEEYSDTKLGRAYARFVIEKVKPLIDSSYRTLPEAENTAVMGSSMGGLISFLFVWWHPNVFSGAGCLSPAFSYLDGGILEEVRGMRDPRKGTRIYLDCGTEDLEARLKPGYDAMVRLLHEKGYERGKNLEYFLDVGATHNEQAWAQRVWRPLKFLFGQ